MPNIIERISGLLERAGTNWTRVDDKIRVQCLVDTCKLGSHIQWDIPDIELAIELRSAAPALMDALKESVDAADQLRELRGALAAGPLGRDVISRRLALVEAALRSKLAVLEE